MIIHLKSKKIVVADETVETTLNLAERAAKTQAPVLICGESGTGKELIARYIHEKSNRAHKPFVSVNCAAIPEGLMEAEFFGYEKGAFTGAIEQRFGKFERANGGTLLLDEISEMPLTLQAKLLRVLQENEIERLGGRETIPISTRILATTNKDLQSLVQEKKFREDLYFRINVISIQAYSLRGREKAIRSLAESFLFNACENQERSPIRLSPEALDKLIQYDWPGNIRELQNTIEKAVWLCEGSELLPRHLILNSLRVAFEGEVCLATVEKHHILKVLQEKHENRKETAEALGINVRTLRNKLKEYQLGE